MRSISLKPALIFATAFAAISLSGCGGGGATLVNVLSGGDFNGASARQLELARQSRREMCCSITITEYNEETGVVLGCGQQAGYAYINAGWTQQSLVPNANAGTPADRLPNCNQ
jgi:hypothetical protein